MTVHDTDDILDDDAWLDDLCQRRLKYIEGHKANEDDINLDILTSGYPDTAHLVYELLQNAEDANASNAWFVLFDDGLQFEHDGRPFNRQDVQKITGIGSSSKSDQDDKIGQFGIGFKAVFVYTETPHIWSSTFSFRISDRFVPDRLQRKPELANLTRFWLPFDSPKKPTAEARGEITNRLKTLPDDTLLFLSKIKKLRWRVKVGQNSASHGRTRRVARPNGITEMHCSNSGESDRTSYFLHFTETCPGLEAHTVAIAFELKTRDSRQRQKQRKQRSTLRNSASATSIAKWHQIVPAKPGRVAVYFTAVKETSNLRFHLHAPFVPDLSRSSIRDTPANQLLFEQLASLAARSLSKIRDLGLLDRDFLAVLPNSKDELSEPYRPIRDAIIEQMRKAPLTPTHDGSHAPAVHLLRSDASLKEMLSREDLRLLRDDKEVRYDWAIAARQRNDQVYRFLEDLEIQPYGVDELVDTLQNRCSDRIRFDPTRNRWIEHNPEPRMVHWLSKKSLDWHRRLYALLHERYAGHSTKLDGLRQTYLVRCSDGQYRKGQECFFETPGVDSDIELPIVDHGTHTARKATDRNTRLESKYAFDFLASVGVRKVDEDNQIMSILKKYYVADNEASWDDHWSHLKRFMRWYDSNNHDAAMFKSYRMLYDCHGELSRPCDLYIDSPYRDTNLQAYYSIVARCAPLSEQYLSYLQRSSNEQSDKFIEFASACGVLDRLKIEETRCINNPRWDYLRQVPGGISPYHYDRDYVVYGLDRALANPTLELASLVWRTLIEISNEPKFLKARYRKNRSKGERTADSQFAHLLRTSYWVPQRGETVGSEADIRFVMPAEAVSERLPGGFPYDSGSVWLAAIEFGSQSEAQRAQRSEMRERLDAAGMPGASDMSEKQAGRHVEFGLLPPDVQDNLLRTAKTNIGSPTGNDQPGDSDVPTYEPRDPTRRAQRVRDEAQDAPNRATQDRERSVSVHREQVKEVTKPYLHGLYTDADDEMWCQLCADIMPFRLPDGSYYFECVEFIEEFKQEDKFPYQNYLALCPNHAAMFKHANPQKEQMKDKFLGMQDRTMSITLAEKPQAIWFNETHQFDLKTLLEADEQRRQAE